MVTQDGETGRVNRKGMVQMTTNTKSLKDLLEGMVAEDARVQGRWAQLTADLAEAGWVRADLPGFTHEWVGHYGSPNLSALRARLDWEAKLLWAADGRPFLMVPRYEFIRPTVAMAHRVLDGRA